jgi:hypothetical protein
MRRTRWRPARLTNSKSDESGDAGDVPPDEKRARYCFGRAQNSACCVGHEDAKRQIRKDRAVMSPHAADVACAVRRRPDHRLTEDSNTFPGQTVACGGQLAAGHWVAVVIVAAFLRIPRMCASGADDQLSHSQQTKKILHFDPRWSRSDRVLARSMRTPTECLKRAIEQLALLAGTNASSAPVLVVKSPEVALSPIWQQGSEWRRSTIC